MTTPTAKKIFANQVKATSSQLSTHWITIRSLIAVSRVQISYFALLSIANASVLLWLKKVK